MNYINITVRGKIARAEGRARVVCGNSDYAVRFDFDAEWAEYTVKTARFVSEDGSYTDVQFEGEDCAIPILRNTRTLLVGVFAGNLRTTTAALIHAVPCITDPDGTPADPTPDVYNQLMERFNAMEAPAAVLYTEQELTYDQKQQARANINATGSAEFTVVNEYNKIASCGATSGVCRVGLAGVPDGLTFPAFFLFSNEHYGKRRVTMLDSSGQFWSGLASYSEIQNMGIVRTVPDWEQNDETAADYIKNRPFYEDTYTEQVYAGAVTNMGTYTLTSPLVVGDAYTVATSYATFNDVICVQNGNIVQLVLPDSNGSINVQDPQNNPLVIMYFGKNGGLNITHKVTEVKKLDAKYLPEYFDEIVLHSSTNGSVKKFKLTVDDTGAVTATEITD